MTGIMKTRITSDAPSVASALNGKGRKEARIMEKVKCINRGCGKVLGPEDDMWQVRLIDGNGFRTYAPACSKECAEAAQRACIELHERRLQEVKQQIFQKMKVKDF